MISLSQLLETLQAAAEDSEGTADAIDALQQHAHEVYQEIFDRGHGEATRKAREQTEQLERDLEQARSELEKREQRIERLEEEQPDVARIESEYQDEIAELKEEAREKMSNLRDQISSERMARARSDLTSTLVQEGVDRDYAEVQVHKAVDNGRIRHTEDGEVEVLQPGKEIPLQVDDPLGSLAEEIHDRTPAKFRSSDADRGSGAEGGSGGGSGSSVYDRIREQAEEERTGSRDPSEELDERLGAGAR